jgi:hypothetical protein
MRLISIALTVCSFIGCGAHNPLRLPGPTETSATIPYDKAEEACALLTTPGDIVLLYLGNSAMGKTLMQLAVYPATLLDVLDLYGPVTKYLHSEIIYEIEPGGEIKTRGFYPLVKRYTDNQFLNSYTIYRINGRISKQEKALDKITYQKYPQTGFCADYVAWAYDNKIYSWWNRIPYLQNILVHIYPPEAIQTADNIADSPETERICEVVNGELVYPEAVDTRVLVGLLEQNIKSENNSISKHALSVLEKLKEHHVIDQSGQIISTSITFSYDKAESATSNNN